MNKHAIYAVSTLVGTIVGMGIFGIPYVVSRSGFLVGVAYLFLLGAATLLIHLVFGEIVLRNKEKHRLVGFAQKYLGKWPKRLIIFTTLFGIYGALIIYILIGGRFLETIFSPLFGGTDVFYAILLWVFLAFPIFKGLKTVAALEVLMTGFFFLVVGIILFVSLPNIEVINFTGLDLNYLFLPYGVILFAMAGSAAIPEIRDILGGREKKLAKTIIIGTLIPAVLYLIFMAAVVGVTGKSTSPEAIAGLVEFLDGKIVILGAMFGVLAGAASFLVLGMYLKDTFQYDFKISKNLASILVVGVPLAGILFGMQDFILIMGLVGVIMGGIEDVILIRIYQKAKKVFDRQPEYNLKIPSPVLYLIVAMFIGGIIYQIVEFL